MLTRIDEQEPIGLIGGFGDNVGATALSASDNDDSIMGQMMARKKTDCRQTAYGDQCRSARGRRSPSYSSNVRR